MKYKVGDKVKFKATSGFGWYEVIDIKGTNYRLKCYAHSSGPPTYDNFYPIEKTDEHSTLVSKLEHALC